MNSDGNKNIIEVADTVTNSPYTVTNSPYTVTNSPFIHK